MTLQRQSHASARTCSPPDDSQEGSNLGKKEAQLRALSHCQCLQLSADIKPESCFLCSLSLQTRWPKGTVTSVQAGSLQRSRIITHSPGTLLNLSTTHTAAKPGNRTVDTCLQKPARKKLSRCPLTIAFAPVFFLQDFTIFLLCSTATAEVDVPDLPAEGFPKHRGVFYYLPSWC